MTRMVLVVDDDPVSRKLARDTLASLGMVVVEATDAENALDLACHVPPDLILMDLRLPGMSGAEALKDLRKSARLARVPVIAVTASVFADGGRSLKQNGFDAYVAKPYHFRDLAEVVERLLST